MKFILEDVFPRLPLRVLEHIDLIVAGDLTDGSYCREVRALASNFPQVHMLGYVNNLVPLFGQADLQLVGGITATGLRTRIIESFVRGLPVLSTAAAAEGVLGIADSENILLANNAQTFAVTLISLLENPQHLAQIARNARKTYEQYHSRHITNARLRELLRDFL